MSSHFQVQKCSNTTAFHYWHLVSYIALLHATDTLILLLLWVDVMGIDRLNLVVGVLVAGLDMVALFVEKVSTNVRRLVRVRPANV